MYKGFNLVIKVCAKIQFRIRSRLSHPVGVASIVHEKIGSSFTWWLYIHTPNLNVHHVASPWTMDLCVLYVLRRHYYLNKWIYRLSHHRRWMCVIHVIVVLVLSRRHSSNVNVPSSICCVDLFVKSFLYLWFWNEKYTRISFCNGTI